MPRSRRSCLRLIVVILLQKRTELLLCRLFMTTPCSGRQNLPLRVTKYPRRIYVPGLPYYVTAVFLQRKPIFREPTFAKLFLRTLDAKCSTFHFLVHGYVLMPDHYHMIVTPPLERAVSDVLRHVNGVFAQEYNCSNNHQGKVWQRNFWGPWSSQRTRFYGKTRLYS